MESTVHTTVRILPNRCNDTTETSRLTSPTSSRLVQKCKLGLVRLSTSAAACVT